MVNIKLSVVFILVAAAVAPAVSLPVPGGWRNLFRASKSPPPTPPKDPPVLPSLNFDRLTFDFSKFTPKDSEEVSPGKVAKGVNKGPPPLRQLKPLPHVPPDHDVPPDVPPKNVAKPKGVTRTRIDAGHHSNPPVTQAVPNLRRKEEEHPTKIFGRLLSPGSNSPIQPRLPGPVPQGPRYDTSQRQAGGHDAPGLSVPPKNDINPKE